MSEIYLYNIVNMSLGHGLLLIQEDKKMSIPTASSELNSRINRETQHQVILYLEDKITKNIKNYLFLKQEVSKMKKSTSFIKKELRQFSDPKYFDDDNLLYVLKMEKFVRYFFRKNADNSPENAIEKK